MAIPPWAIELLRRSVADVASKTNTDAVDRLRAQAASILNDIPAAAARTVDSVMSATETRRQAVRDWAKTYTSKSREVINASGVLIDPPSHSTGGATVAMTGNRAIGVAIDADVLEAGMEFFDGSRTPGPGLEAWKQSVLSKVTSPVHPSGEPLDIAITRSLAAAVALVPTMSGFPLTLHRSQAVNLPGGGSVPDLIGSLGFAFKEFGSIDGYHSGDFAVPGSMSTIFVGQPPSQRTIGDGLRVDVLPVTLVSSDGLPISIPTLAGSLASGADVVIAATGGLIGGPDTGIVIGRSSAIAAMRQHRLFPLFSASTADAAMTIAALARDPMDIPGSAVSRLTTSIENLQSRASRLSVRLAGSDQAVETSITENDAQLSPGGLSVPSRQVRVRGTSLNHSVLTRQDGDSTIIDLRWVAPEQDTLI